MPALAACFAAVAFWFSNFLADGGWMARWRARKQADRERMALRLFGEQPHCILQPFEGERKHAPAHDLLNDGGALLVLP